LRGFSSLRSVIPLEINKTLVTASREDNQTILPLPRGGIRRGFGKSYHNLPRPLLSKEGK
jgi:hypothetical protein